MARDKLPTTQAVCALRETAWPSPTMEDRNKRPLIVLVHGDREVSTKNLARFVGVKHVSLCEPPVSIAIPATRSAA